MLLLALIGHKNGKGLGECRGDSAQTHVLV